MIQNNFKIVNLKKRDEIKAAFKLSLKCFYPGGTSNEIKSFWSHKWGKEPYTNFSNVFALKFYNNQIGGCIRVISRKIYRYDIQYKVLGIAETFVDPKYQGIGIAKILTSHVIKTFEIDYDLMFIVARKNIDNFYLKFNCFGLSSYMVSEMTISGKAKKKYSILNLEEQDLDHVGKLYNLSYKYCFGRFERDISYWRFLLISSRYNHNRFFSVKKEGVLKGYFVLSKSNDILEIGLDKNTCYRQVLLNIKNKFKSIVKSPKWSLKVPVNHKIFSKDLRFDTSVKYRECYFGGHVLKILNLNNVIKKAEERLTIEFKNLRISALDFEFERLKIFWDGVFLKIVCPPNLIPSYNESSFLLGIKKIYGKQITREEIYKVPFCISSLDEF